MAVEGIQRLVPGLTAGADLSSNFGYIVKMTANYQVGLCSAATDCPVGVLSNAPKANQEADVVCEGIVKVKLNGTVTAGDRIGTDASGMAVKYVEGTGTTDYILGQMLEGGVAGDIRSCLIGGTPHRAA